MSSDERPNALRAVVEVANLAYRKDVRLRYKAPGGSWLDSVPGRYLRSVSSSRDLFVVEVTERSAQFAVRYEVAGQVYWDNNGGKDYRFEAAPGGSPYIGQPVLGRGRDIVVVGAKECADTTDELCVTALVRSLSVRQMTSLFYTTYVDRADAWRLVNRKKNGLFEGISDDGSLARWTVRVPLDDGIHPRPTSVEFAANLHLWYPDRDRWDKTTSQDFACDAFVSAELRAWRCINGGTYDRRFALPQNRRDNGALETYWPTGDSL